ncbi:MAG: hypothetical protein ACOYXR_06610 [Nitrospirota bacterium]
MNYRPISDHIGIIAAIGGILTVTVVLFTPSFRYGFVSDDFLEVTLTSWSQVWAAWVRDGFRRPLDEVYFLTFYKLFGFDPQPFRLFLLALYSTNTLLVYFFIRGLLRDKIAGAAVAVLFAANLVQFRNIYWISNSIFLMETFFFLVALYCYVESLERGNRAWIVAALGIALFGVLMTKEHLVMFPVVAAITGCYHRLALTGSLTRDDIVSIARSAKLFLLVPLIFFLSRAAATAITETGLGCPYDLQSCLNANEADPFRVSLFGPHLLINFMQQAYWNLGNIGAYVVDSLWNESSGILEWRNISWPQYLITCGYGLAIVGWHRMFNQNGAWWYLVLGLLWFFTILAPVLVLPNHSYPYFSSFASIGLWIALIIPFRGLQGLWGRSAARVGILALVLLFTANSIYWVSKNLPTHLITSTSRFLSGLEGHLKLLHPTLPHGATLVFLNIGNWHLGYNKAPIVMYRDPSIQIFSKEDLQVRDGRLSLPENRPFSRTSTFVFLLTPNGLREVTREFFSPDQKIQFK